ncbi:MAG: class I SAM-dependent methyltransferase, partial [Bdellovibrionales bacterium]|nr:class I SAM-dependent methyltransferase [Bdellovibrionales bacterium]
MTSELPSSDCLNSHSELLDGIYRLQRHFYDLTRKYYLFGRDTVIQRIAQTPPKSVLEVGCGTGRNLNHIARSIRPLPKLCGLDASQEMLKHARL